MDQSEIKRKSLTYDEVTSSCSVLKQPSHNSIDQSKIERKLNTTAKLATKCKIRITCSSLRSLCAVLHCGPTLQNHDYRPAENYFERISNVQPMSTSIRLEDHSQMILQI